MAQNQHAAASAREIDRLAVQLATDPRSKAFMPLAEEYGKVGMWQEAAGVLEDGLTQAVVDTSEGDHGRNKARIQVQTIFEDARGFLPHAGFSVLFGQWHKHFGAWILG